jgi:hypothetical protein
MSCSSTNENRPAQNASEREDGVSRDLSFAGQLIVRYTLIFIIAADRTSSNE